MLGEKWTALELAHRHWGLWIKLSGVSLPNKDRRIVLFVDRWSYLVLLQTLGFFYFDIRFLLMNFLLMVAVIKHLVSILSSMVSLYGDSYKIWMLKTPWWLCNSYNPVTLCRTLESALSKRWQISLSLSLSIWLCMPSLSLPSLLSLNLLLLYSKPFQYNCLYNITFDFLKFHLVCL